MKANEVCKIASKAFRKCLYSTGVYFPADVTASTSLGPKELQIKEKNEKPRLSMSSWKMSLVSHCYPMWQK